MTSHTVAIASGFSDDVEETIHAVYFPGEVHRYGLSGRGLVILVILKLCVVLVSIGIATWESVVLL